MSMSFERIVKSKRLLMIAGLVLCSAASSSYAKSKTAKNNQCIANVNELEAHPDNASGCNKKQLTQQFARVPKGKLEGQGWASGKILEFPQSVPNGAFYIVLDGEKVRGQICCAEGVWSIGGYGVINVDGGVLSIGGYKFKKPVHAELNSTPVGPATVAKGRG